MWWYQCNSFIIYSIFRGLKLCYESIIHQPWCCEAHLLLILRFLLKFLSGTKTWDNLFNFEDITTLINWKNAPAKCFGLVWLQIKVSQNTQTISIVKCIKNTNGEPKGHYSKLQFRWIKYSYPISDQHVFFYAYTAHVPDRNSVWRPPTLLPKMKKKTHTTKTKTTHTKKNPTTEDTWWNYLNFHFVLCFAVFLASCQQDLYAKAH